MNIRTKKLLVNTLIIITAFYVVICCLAYFLQEKLIFFPEKLSKDHRFRFDQPFQEMSFTMKDGKLVNGVLFKADSSRGLIFYLHGNAGSLDGWGEVATFYTDAGYDLFMLDYRGYGKSEGVISSQNQFYSDVQSVYDSIKTAYQEDSIIILGYSIGTGAATRLASRRKARMLLLQAPYYSLTHMMRSHYPFLPPFLLKYKFETNQFLPQCKMPVVLFHGDADEVISYESSVKLSKLFKEKDTLITLQGAGHNGMSERDDYREAFIQIVQRSF
ncbi:alpha/beta hydrolase [Pseudoflavitalea sp. X16]|uniref:alpha/beta hydrolase n=1 Tax=Paraflavitalea devenefica TaxID=2716334 RepID=UPI001420A72C|nr:alpha/beta fold hydrolase [Paraflavitalea devenefica]NII27191.1 alpha/beta hydrolase [Paraflavitalea devenefica]